MDKENRVTPAEEMSVPGLVSAGTRLTRAMLAVCLICCHVLRADEVARPNVLFIAVDDLNAWVTHLGRNTQAKTPNIDRLARLGVTFERAYCVVPACNPSRAALMTGQRPWTTACYLNRDSWKEHTTSGFGLSAQFKKAGYRVVGAGKIYHNDTWFDAEWSQYMNRNLYSPHGQGVKKDEGFHIPLQHDLQDEDPGDWKIVNWCIEQLNEERSEPFFIACGLHKPHLPFAVPRKYYELFPLDEIQLPPHLENDLDDIPTAGVRMARPNQDHARFLSSGRWKAAIQSYLATCAYVDMNIGRLLDALERSPHADNTVIVLWGDHGWSFGEKSHWRKFALWEEPTRAPLIWVAPGVTQAGTVCKRPVDFMMIYPTLCDIAGIEIPDHVEGRSAIDLLRDPEASWPYPAITTYGFQNHAVRTETHRYIRYADGSEELYDHRQDPYEWDNLALLPESSPVLRKLRRYLPGRNAPPRRAN
jgi:arylsulfatase A-like enzyme